MASTLAARLRVPWVELDAIYHQAGWQPLPVEEFRARVVAAIAADGWVVDGNYSAVQDLVWARADTVIWLDLPRWRVMGQLIWRSVNRAALGTRLWNGNRETWRGQFWSRDSLFWLCELSFVDPRFRKYPALPVLQCDGFVPEPAP